MPIDVVTCPRSCRLLVGAAIFVVSGCTTGANSDPDPTSAIKGHYAAHATEEQGACKSPKIDTIQERRLLDESADGKEIMMVRYSYFDGSVDMDARWDKLVHLSQPCGGIAERRFVLARSDVGYRVTAMSGERRGGDDVR